MPQICDMGPTALLPLWRKACWGFFCPKNPTASAGFEPANLGINGQHATPRPPKPMIHILRDQNFIIIKILDMCLALTELHSIHALIHVLFNHFSLFHLLMFPAVPVLSWNVQHLLYSGTSIYRSRNDCFPACTVRNFWSRIKFHINNVICSRIHRSPNYRFPALIVCKSRSQRSISRMDRLKKKLKQSIY